MIGPQHICVVYVATAGLQGPLMGSDEQEIVLLIYVIIDAVQKKVRSEIFYEKALMQLSKYLCRNYQQNWPEVHFFSYINLLTINISC